MFRKLVSNLPFSPALVGQLGFYARRLRKEEVTRRLGLLLTVMALVVQSFAVFSPPEQALASNNSDVIPGGISSVSQIVNVYDAGAKGQNDFKDLMDYLGITRSELASMSSKVEYVCSSDKEIISFGRQQRYSSAEGQLLHNVPRQTGGFSAFYSVPLYRFDSVNNRVNCYDSYIGHSKKIGWFSIMRKCGNVEIKRNVQKFPKAHFVSATCKTVTGYAYDERQPSLPVKVYLYFDGPPGKGKQYGPITASQSSPSGPIGSGHGFSFAVAEEYQKSNRPVKVWAVMQPLAGWNQTTVQFDNVVEIPGNCAPTQTPIAECSNLKVVQIDRARIKLEASARAEQGASITGYKFAVSDKEGHKVYEDLIASSELSVSSDEITLVDSGEYSSTVTVQTSLGDKQSEDCAKIFNISPPDSCPYFGSSGISEEDSDCKPCTYDNSLWVKDENCVPNISQSKEARNMTKQLANANGTTAQPSDRLEFTIHTTNIGEGTVTTVVDENLSDVLEYAQLVDSGGGVLNQETQVLSWGEVKLGPQETDVRKVVVEVKSEIPATPRGANDPATYNCVMTNSYGNTIDINVACPPVKAVESAVKQLPKTGTGANVAFATITLILVTYFYARSRQLKKEIQLLRKDANSGSII